ncbi:hypothetical protein QVD17_17338 [Tagetes erecta]|uniref:Secreted protein n=1 Tax=Tagetes erecta TaxID=13708 RepID=A0AAD8KT13_TARER|nr:hypothetical protein QVD17_17338 [Tagetes erecta]
MMLRSVVTVCLWMGVMVLETPNLASPAPLRPLKPSVDAFYHIRLSPELGCIVACVFDGLTMGEGSGGEEGEEEEEEEARGRDCLLIVELGEEGEVRARDGVTRRG